MTKDKSNIIGKIGFVVAIVIVILVISLMSGSGRSKEESVMRPVLSDTVVAVINNDFISKESFEKEVSLSKMSLESRGIDFSTNDDLLPNLRKQTLATMVNQVLILQDAKVKGINPTGEEIDEQINVVKERFAGDEEFNKELANANLTFEELKENITKDFTVQKYLDEEISVESVAVTEEEISKFYEEVVKVENESAPAFSEMREPIEGDLRDKKISEAIQTIIKNLKEVGHVEIAPELKS